MFLPIYLDLEIHIPAVCRSSCYSQEWSYCGLLYGTCGNYAWWRL